MSARKKAESPKRGDVLAAVGPWTITVNDPGYSMLVQFEGGKQRFLTHAGATALTVALIDALRRDPSDKKAEG